MLTIRPGRGFNKISSKDAPPAGPAGVGVQSPVESTTLIYTIFTTPAETTLVYSATNWVKVKMTLEDAGPVQIGTKPNLIPVLSGAGRLLPTDEEIEFILAKGTRLYIAAEAINRVATTIEPVPWGELLVMRVTDILRALVGRP